MLGFGMGFLEDVKSGFNEFTKSLTEENKDVIEQINLDTKLAEAEKGLNTALEFVLTALDPSRPTSPGESVEATMEPAMSKLQIMGSTKESYLVDPVAKGIQKPYSEVRDTFELDPEVASVLEHDSRVSACHDELVKTGEVEVNDFWCRYLYRVEQLEYEDEMRAKLLSESTSPLPVSTWDDVDSPAEKDIPEVDETTEADDNSNEDIKSEPDITDNKSWVEVEERLADDWNDDEWE